MNNKYSSVLDMKILFVVILFISTLLVDCIASTDLQSQLSRTVVYKAGESGYSNFRIPAIVLTKSGVLLAFAEARKRYGDAGDIDLVVRRSVDGGVSWSDIIVVWDDDGNTCGNPAPVVDSRSGRVVLLMTWNKGSDTESEIMSRKSEDSRRVFVCYSDDDGESWSNPHDITSLAKEPSWTWYATGPCHALQMHHKSYRGRMVIPCNHAVYNGKGSDYNSHLLLSDDCGATWRIGGTMIGGNESTVAELADGRIMYNARWQSGDERFARHYAISNDGGESLGAVVRDATLVEPVCQGSIIGYSSKYRPTDKLLFCNPASTNRREQLTLRLSKDGGKSWSEGIVVASAAAAYSDIVVLKNRDVGVLCETGVKSPYEQIEFVIVKKNMIK